MTAAGRATLHPHPKGAVMALLTAPGETLNDALTDLGKIAGAQQIADETGTGVLVIRRPDRTVVAAFHDDETPAGTIRDEAL